MNKDCLKNEPYKSLFEKYKQSFSNEVLETSGHSYHQKLESLLHEIAHMILIWPDSYKEKLLTTKLCNHHIDNFINTLSKDVADEHEINATLSVGKINKELNLGLDEEEIIKNASWNVCDGRLCSQLKGLGVDYLSDERLNKPIVKTVAGKLMLLIND